MSKHHPNTALLQRFCNGDLNASLSLAIAAHLELCDSCHQQCEQIEQGLLGAWLDNTQSHSESEADLEPELWQIFEQVTQSDATSYPVKRDKQSITIKGQSYKLPLALSNLPSTDWQGLGKIARSRIELDEGETRASLLHIEAGGEIPQHTHNGFELTVLLEGEFSDEDGHYQPGDFLWRDQRNTHTPSTQTGCLCFTVANDSLHFTKGLSKLLNPIGTLIY